MLKLKTHNFYFITRNGFGLNDSGGFRSDTLST
jgi:hypothetical protein